MLIAFVGASGRTDAVHASLLAARAAVAADGFAVYVDYEGGVSAGAGGRLQVVPATGRIRPGILSEVAASCRREGIAAFAAVDAQVLRSARARKGIDMAVIAVGPYLAEERSAIRLLDEVPVPVRHLGCRRAGGSPALTRFRNAMGVLDPASKVLPYVLPPLSRGEAAALATASPRGRTLRAGLRLLSALRSSAAEGRADGTTHDDATDAHAAGMERDERNLADRLRELADDVDAAEAGLAPNAADLAGAPVLDLWDHTLVPTRVLTGLVTGHPNVPDGRPARTTEIFLTDNVTYARTLSRWYALRTPAGAAAPNLQ